MVAIEVTQIRAFVAGLQRTKGVGGCFTFLGSAGAWLQGDLRLGASIAPSLSCLDPDAGYIN
jgi:hypothetical protein